MKDIKQPLTLGPETGSFGLCILQYLAVAGRFLRLLAGVDERLLIGTDR